MTSFFAAVSRSGTRNSSTLVVEADDATCAAWLAWLTTGGRKVGSSLLGSNSPSPLVIEIHAGDHYIVDGVDVYITRKEQHA